MILEKYWFQVSVVKYEEWFLQRVAAGKTGEMVGMRMG